MDTLADEKLRVPTDELLHQIFNTILRHNPFLYVAIPLSQQLENRYN